MFKKMLIVAPLPFVASGCVYFSEWFFNAKNPGYYFYSLVGIINTEIDIEKHGVQKVYEQINNGRMGNKYIGVSQREFKEYGKVIRKDLTSEEFRYYVPFIVSNLKNTQYYKRFDKKMTNPNNHNYTSFIHNFEFDMKTIREKGDKIKLIYIDDNKAHIYVP